jgi:dynein heavy chain
MCGLHGRACKQAVPSAVSGSYTLPRCSPVFAIAQERKFKAYCDDLAFILREYSRAVHNVIPVTGSVLRPHLADLEYRLRPGMVALTWSSMNIDSFKDAAHAAIKVR